MMRVLSHLRKSGAVYAVFLFFAAATGLAVYASTMEPQRASAGPLEPRIEPVVRDDPTEVVPGSALDTRSQALDTLHVAMLAASYPRHIEEIRRFDGEWALRIGDTWFFWEEGRLLPEDLRSQQASYTALHFYNYRTGPYEVPELTEAQKEALRDYEAQVLGQSSGALHRGEYGRHTGFLDALWGFSNAREADRAMQRIRFLNIDTRVHPDIVGPLRGVERDIRAAMQSDSEVRAFVENILMVSGFFWREVPGTNVRSFHAYGTAVDLLPRRYNGFGYWRWARDSGVREWWDVPLEQRYRVPPAIVTAFETHGFVWGGKWALFDPVHFEYRPEVVSAARARALPPVEARSVYSPPEASILR